MSANEDKAPRINGIQVASFLFRPLYSWGNSVHADYIQLNSPPSPCFNELINIPLNSVCSKYLYTIYSNTGKLIAEKWSRKFRRGTLYFIYYEHDDPWSSVNDADHYIIFRKLLNYIFETFSAFIPPVGNSNSTQTGLSLIRLLRQGVTCNGSYEVKYFDIILWHCVAMKVGARLPLVDVIPASNYCMSND